MSPQQDHYFVSKPAASEELASVRVRLAGRDLDVVTARGIFSPGGLDRGTAVLLREAPEPPATGTFLDLGCGWGPIALTLALLSPGADVYGVDVNERAVDLLSRNATRLGLERVHASRPDGIRDGVSFDLIWSNPPIRVGKAALHELLRTWLPRLAPGGTAYLVVAKDLGADSLLRWLGATFADGYAARRTASDKGFRILTVTRHQA